MGVGDRRARGEAGMSVLKWRLAQINNKTRDRDRAARADRDDIELITDEANNAAAAANTLASGATNNDRQPSGSGTSSRREPATVPSSIGRPDKRRLGMRDKLGLSQVQRGREIRRVEMRRKKSRKHSDDDDDTSSAAAETAGIAAPTAGETTATDGRTAHAADGEQHTARGRREEESKQQLEAARDGAAAGGGDFISALHHSHDNKAEAHDEGDEERRRRKDKQHEGQSLRVALEGHTSGSAIGERGGKRSGPSSTRPLTLSQQLQRLHRASDESTNARHTAHLQQAASAATSRPHTPPAAAHGTAPAPVPTASPPAARSVDELSYSLSCPPPTSLPFFSALSHSLAFFRSSSLKRRWSHFRSLCLSPSCVSLARSLYFLTFVDNFQNDGQLMRDAILVDINTHFSRLGQLLDITLTLPSNAYTDDDNALYARLLTVLPEDVVVSSSTSNTRPPLNDAVKARLLTALPLLLSSAVFSLLYSLFPLSRHLLTLSFLHRLDCSLIALTCGFDMADSTVARQRAVYFSERPLEQFNLSNLPLHVNGRRHSNVREGRPAAAAADQLSAGSTAGGANMFSRGDWARDEKERREQMERRKALTSPHSAAPSALSPDFIRSDSTLSPYQRVLLLDLLTPPSGNRQQQLNANSLSPLLAVGLNRCTPDSSWRLEHKLRYVVPAHSPSSHKQPQSSEYGGGAEHRAVRSSVIEEEAERWVRKMRGDGSRRSRQRGKASAEHDEASTAAGRASNSSAVGHPNTNAASTSSSSGQRDRIVEGDPLAVLTPRTRKLVLRYSAKEDDDDSQSQQQSKESKASKVLASPALVSSNAKDTAGAQLAEVVALDLAASGADATEIARKQQNTARKTTTQSDNT